MRRVLFLAIVALVLASPTAAPAKATKTEAFAQLRAEIRAASNLTAAERRQALALVRRAQASRPCPALTTLEELRVALRGSRVRGVTTVELAILKTKASKKCAHASKRVRIAPEIPLVGGPIPLLAPVREKPEEDEGRADLPVESAPDGIDRGPQTTVTPAPFSAAAAAAGPFTFHTITDLGVPKFADRPAEPSQASAGKVVWYTGNSGAAFSLDGGKTFKGADPRRMFPSGDRAFCCDQLVVYAPKIDRFVWLLQYWCPKPDQYCDELGSANELRVLTASPAAIARHRKDPGSAWNRWVIHPGDLGLPHHFLDYPDLAVSGRSVLLTMNVFGKKFGSVVARVSLGDLKRARNLKLDYYFDRNGDTYRIAQQGGNRAFVAGHATGTDLLTLAWDRGSPLLFEHRTPHTEIATYDYESLTEGVDWGERLDASVQGGTQRGNELWFAWAEGRSVCLRRCGGGRPVLDDLWPQPHVHVVVVDARTFDLVRERFIHNDDYAIGYPTLATDSLGRVGMSFSFGGGTVGNASPAAGYLTDTEEFHQVVSSPGPGDQGDYMSLRPDWPDQTRFTGSGYVTQDDEPRWIFYRYSR